jgi:ATP adenylyltransferase
MDRIWAPWRSQYIRESAQRADVAGAPAETACFLCQGLASGEDRSNLLVWRRSHSAVFLNKYPYNNGHLLVCPLVHSGTIGALSGASLTEPLETIQKAVSALDRLLRPQGYNIGLNQGKSAGAGLPGHLHWHIVPRWDGDTNFMPVLGGAKVIIESLDEFYDRFASTLHEVEAIHGRDSIGRTR